MVQGGAPWSLGSALSVSAARLWGPGGAPRGAEPRGIPRKIGAKQSRPEILLRRLNAKSSQTMVFELAVGFKKFGRRQKKGGSSRAMSPPRLAAGAGDRNAETLMDFYVLGP